MSRPHINHPSLVPSGSLFDEFPFLLPCLFVSVINFFVFFIIFFKMEETIQGGGLCKEQEEGEGAEEDMGEKEGEKKRVGILEILKEESVLVSASFYFFFGLFQIMFMGVFFPFLSFTFFFTFLFSFVCFDVHFLPFFFIRLSIFSLLVLLKLEVLG